MWRFGRWILWILYDDEGIWLQAQRLCGVLYVFWEKRILELE